MTDKIYLLWFVQERDGNSDTELLIGVFTSELDAESAIGQLKAKPGFAAYQTGFQIHAHKIGQIGWTDGFIEEDAIAAL